MNKVFYFSFSRFSMRRTFLVFLLFSITVLASCKFEVRLKGVVIDEINRLHVFNAQVRILKGINGRTVDFIDVRTNKEGRFEFFYNSNQLMADTLSVEVSKEKYLSNMYKIAQNSLDTIVLIRSIKNDFDFLKNQMIRKRIRG